MSITAEPTIETEARAVPAQVRIPGDEILRRAWAVYYQHRSEIETDENIGRFITIEVQTGDYEIGEDNLQILFSLRSRHQDPANATLRIGYTTAYKRGGVMQRLPQL